MLAILRKEWENRFKGHRLKRTKTILIIQFSNVSLKINFNFTLVTSFAKDYLGGIVSCKKTSPLFKVQGSPNLPSLHLHNSTNITV